MADYRVIPFSADALLDLFAELADSRRDDVDGKLHSTYFPEYFKQLAAKTIVVEEDYVDRDYLEDFAGYYVRCFKAPESHCARLHFFQSEFDDAAFTTFLEGNNPADFLKDFLNDDVYLGFIVVKPLAQTFIGRTCLRTYPDGATGRHFPSLHAYDANLFGVHLTVNSLAFQEQDTEVARCATAAMWSVLQGTAAAFNHSVPTPVEITKNALAVHANRSRTLPAKDGLTVEQLADAIRRMNLEPYCVSAADREILQTEAYAYLRAGIPALLGIALVDTLDEQGQPLAPATLYGLHAVALTGYHLSNNPPVAYGQSNLLLRASRIDKFYAHDDQIGAFARMTLSPVGQTMQWDDPRYGMTDSTYMECSWYGRSRQVGSVRAVPETLLVPLYPKMRIPFQDALGATNAFDSAVMALAAQGHIALAESLEWDIYLTTAAQLKQDLASDGTLQGGYRAELLTASMPRFIWRAVGLRSGAPAVELLFDATDIVQGRFFLRAIEYDPTLLSILRHPDAVMFATSLVSRTILEWFAIH